MSLTKSVLTRSDRNKRIQKIQKKVVRSERGIAFPQSVTNENIINVQRTDTYYSTAKLAIITLQLVVIHHSKLILSNKCPECMSENLEYYSTSTNRLIEYILNNIN